MTSLTYYIPSLVFLIGKLGKQLTWKNSFLLFCKWDALRRVPKTLAKEWTLKLTYKCGSATMSAQILDNKRESSCSFKYEIIILNTI